MKPKARYIHILDKLSCVEGRQQCSKTFRMLGLNALRASGLEEFPQALVPERLNHPEDNTVLRITQQDAFALSRSSRRDEEATATAATAPDAGTHASSLTSCLL
jgi:hypothetical protein